MTKMERPQGAITSVYIWERKGRKEGYFTGLVVK
jgi:hypothetical protein